MEEFIEVNETLTLCPFRIPNFAISKEPHDGSHLYPLGALSEDALSKLADRFRRDLFAKARKQAEDRHRV